MQIWKIRIFWNELAENIYIYIYFLFQTVFVFYFSKIMNLRLYIFLVDKSMM